MEHKRRSKIIYVSGKYTVKTDNGELDLVAIRKNIMFARDYSIKIWDAGYTALCPHLNTYLFENNCNCDYNDYIEGDLYLLEKCDAIFLMSNWKDSKGAIIEKKYAILKGIPIVYSIDDLHKQFDE